MSYNQPPLIPYASKPSSQGGSYPASAAPQDSHPNYPQAQQFSQQQQYPAQQQYYPSQQQYNSQQYYPQQQYQPPPQQYCPPPPQQYYPPPAPQHGYGHAQPYPPQQQHYPPPSQPPPAPVQSVWQPAVGTSWQIILSNTIKLAPNASSVAPDVDVFDLDLFETPKETVDTLHRLGKKVIAYFSAGSWEPNRPDSDAFAKEDLGKTMEGWEKEKWIDVRSTRVRELMKRRIELAREKGFDAVDPDNVDGFDNKNGLNLKKQDSINFMIALADHAHSLGLGIGLKNAGAIIKDVLPYVQFSVNEQCVEYNEAASFMPFINAGKPVFHIEYPDELGRKKTQQLRERTGPAGNIQGYSTVMKKMGLDGWVEYLDGTKVTTSVHK